MELTPDPNRKKPHFDPGRREFLGTAAAALLAGAAVHLTGCGANLSGPGGTVPPTGSDVGFVGTNHPEGQEHVAFVTPAQMNTGDAVSLHIQGYADHDHLVILSSANVATIRGGSRGDVNVSSTTTNSDTYGFHSHLVTF